MGREGGSDQVQRLLQVCDLEAGRKCPSQHARAVFKFLPALPAIRAILNCSRSIPTAAASLCSLSFFHALTEGASAPDRLKPPPLGSGVGAPSVFCPQLSTEHGESCYSFTPHTHLTRLAQSRTDTATVSFARAIGTLGAGITAGLMLSVPLWQIPASFKVDTLALRDRLVSRPRVQLEVDTAPCTPY